MRISMVSVHSGAVGSMDSTAPVCPGEYPAALAAGLVRLGHEVTVYARRDHPALPVESVTPAGYRQVYVPAGPAAPVRDDEILGFMGEFARFLNARWADDPPAVAHAHFWTSGLAAQLAARRIGCPTVQTFHLVGALEQRHRGASTVAPNRIHLEELIARGASRVVATGTEEVLAIARMGLRRSQIAMVPRGVDLDLFTPNGRVVQRRAPRRIVAAGHLLPCSGFDVTIAALAELPGVELVIAGGPSTATLRDDPEVQRLRSLATRFGVAERVLLTGRIRRERMPALLRSADAVVCTPTTDHFGMVALEAMACGVPVVAATVGGLFDTVAHGVTGLLVPPRDPMAVAAELRRLFVDDAARAEFGRAGRERARSRYSWDRVTADIAHLYRSLTAISAQPQENSCGSIRRGSLRTRTPRPVAHRD